MSTDWLSPEGVTAIAAVVGLSGIYFEYYRQRKVHSVELAQRMLERLETEDMMAFALLCLDWGAGAIPVPLAWQKMVGTPYITADPSSVIEATAFELTRSIRDDPRKLLFRHAFVSLFNHLERVAYLVKEKTIEVHDLRPMKWIADYIVYWEYAPDGAQHHPFRSAIEGWYERDNIMVLVNALRESS